MSVAIDRDYEMMDCEPQWKVVYDWEIRQYRWMLLAPVDCGRNVRPDPDALLEPDLLPSDYPALAAAGRKAANILRGRSEETIRVCLETYGALPVKAIVKHTGLNMDTVRASLLRRPDLFGRRKAGREYQWYLVGDNDNQP